MLRGVIAGLLGALLHGPGAAAAVPAAPPDDASREAPRQPARIGAVIVVTEDIDADEMIDALVLRAPDRTIQPAGQARPHVQLFVVAEVRMKDAHTVALAVIASDFRAWYRTVEATPEDAPRVAASALANLLAGIEEDRELPDAQDVPLPQGATAEPEPPASKPEPPAPRAEPTSPKPGQPRPELLVELAGAPVIAIPPPGPSGLAAGGGTLALGIRTPRGLLGDLELRAAGRSVDDLGLARVRVSVQIGIALRRGSFELLATAGPDIEPIVARRGGRREDFRFPDGTPRATALLVGGHLRLSPGVRFALGSGQLRIGPRVELGGSGLESGGVARLFTEGDEPLLRAGGLELSAGLELGGWIALGRRGAPSGQSGP